jgi:hypothetical protein
MHSCVTEFVPFPQIKQGEGGLVPLRLIAKACIPQYSFLVGRVQYSFVPLTNQWHGMICLACIAYMYKRIFKMSSSRLITHNAVMIKVVS